MSPILKLYRSSTIGIISENFRLLCDPWLEDGEYYGSWSHYPPYNLDENINEINSYHAIYISHIHPDHCSEKTLKKISKNIPVYILAYHSKFLKFKLETLGFKVNEIHNFETKFLGKNFKIKIIAADNCDPALCYKFNGCANILEKNETQQIDSLALIEVNGVKILNLNDCPYELAKSTFKKLLNNKKIDLLMLGYGGAGPYPQCFENLNYKDKIIKAKKKRNDFLNNACNFINELNPKFFLPFAGSYFLSGKLSSLHYLRGVPTIEYASNYLEKNIITKSKCIKLNVDSYLNLNNFETSSEYQPIIEKDIREYLDNILSKRKLSYELDEEVDNQELFDLSKKAHLRYQKKIKELNIELESNILIRVLKKYIFIDNKNHQISLIDSGEIYKMNNYVIYDLDLKLLKKILMGPRYAHWNNAEIGSHIKFFRKPDFFDRKIYNAICYFHV
jgi:UDP-MurNAc hydroxylase